jgi:predicted nucleic-acid-binding protein
MRVPVSRPGARRSVKNTHVVDANVILRFLVGDHPEYFQKSSAFMAKVKAGEVNAYVPEGVLVECVYVLLKVYGVPRGEIAEKLIGLLSYKGMVGENRTSLMQGLRLFSDHNVDIVDALITAIAVERGWQAFSFDKDLLKLSQ